LRATPRHGSLRSMRDTAGDDRGDGRTAGRQGWSTLLPHAVSARSFVCPCPPSPTARGRCRGRAPPLASLACVCRGCATDAACRVAWRHRRHRRVGGQLPRVAAAAVGARGMHKQVAFARESLRKFRKNYNPEFKLKQRNAPRDVTPQVRRVRWRGVATGDLTACRRARACGVCRRTASSCDTTKGLVSCTSSAKRCSTRSTSRPCAASDCTSHR
jgi:hypothetical protein